MYCFNRHILGAVDNFHRAGVVPQFCCYDCVVHGGAAHNTLSIYPGLLFCTGIGSPNESICCEHVRSVLC